jgi:UDP-glucose 4-epimerase
MKWLVTGGFGYIGSHLAMELAEHTEHEIFIVDDLSGGSLNRNLLGLNYQIADISHMNSMDHLFREHRFDGVFHLAAKKSVEESMRDSELYFLKNVIGTEILLESAAKYKTSFFIFASTCAVYGDIPSCKEGIKESSALAPSNYYGETKKLAEDLVHKYSANFETAIFRFFNVIGAADPRLVDIESGSLLANLVKSIITNRKFEIFGKDFLTYDGTAIRDYVDVRDIAFALRIAAETMQDKKLKSRVYNIGNNKGVSVLEFVTAFYRILGTQPEINYSCRRTGDIESIFADTSQIQLELGFKCKFQIDQSIKSSLTSQFRFDLP